MALNKSEIHKVFDPYFEAAANSKYRVVVLPMNMVFFEPPLWFKGLANFLAIKVMILLAHIRFAVSLPKLALKNDLIIVREFLTVPTFLVWPILFFFRRKLLFIINHNVQYMVESRLQRIAFRLLSLCGGRYLFLESSSGSELALNQEIISDCLVLPIPIDASDNAIQNVSTNSNDFVVGVIGDFRKEKGNSKLLEHLIDVVSKNSVSWRILVGTNNPMVLSKCSKLNITTIDTSSESEYLRAYAESDVVVLNYQKAAYYYRSSGAICDAIKFRTPVICPNYPILSDQVSDYGLVGLVFSDMHEIADKIELISSSDFNNGFNNQIAERSVFGITEKIDAFIKTKRTPS